MSSKTYIRRRPKPPLIRYEIERLTLYADTLVCTHSPAYDKGCGERAVYACRRIAPPPKGRGQGTREWLRCPSHARRFAIRHGAEMPK